MHTSMKHRVNFPYGDNKNHMSKPITKCLHNIAKPGRLQSVTTTIGYTHEPILNGVKLNNT